MRRSGVVFPNDGPCASTAVATMTSASSDIWAKSCRTRERKQRVCSETAGIAGSSLMIQKEREPASEDG